MSVTTRVGSDDRGDAVDSQRNAAVVVSGAQEGHHDATDVTYLGVVEDAFEAVTDLNAVLSSG